METLEGKIIGGMVTFFFAAMSVILGFRLTAQKKDSDDMSKRVGELENKVVRLEAFAEQILPMQTEMRDDIKSMLIKVSAIDERSLANLGNNKSLLQK